MYWRVSVTNSDPTLNIFVGCIDFDGKWRWRSMRAGRTTEFDIWGEEAYQEISYQAAQFPELAVSRTLCFGQERPGLQVMAVA